MLPTATNIAPTLTPTPTATLSATTTAAPTPVPFITFVAAGPLTDSAQPLTTIVIGVPAGIEAGDVLLTQIVINDATGANVPKAPAGWTAIRDDAVSNTNKLTSWLYFHVAGSSDTGFMPQLEHHVAICRRCDGGVARRISFVADRSILGVNPCGRSQSRV